MQEASPFHRMRIVPFPANCSEAIDRYKSTIQYYTESLHVYDEVLIELGHVTFFSPMALNILAGMVFELLRNGQKVYLTYPKDRNVLQYLTDQGFTSEFPTLSSGQLVATPKSTSVGLRRLDELDGNYLSQVALWLHTNSRISKTKVEDMVMIAMPEVINNVFDHSRSPFGCYVCAQAYIANRRLLLSVMDFGIGFLRSLSPSYPTLQEDEEAIALATQAGVSSKTSPRNAGRGLYILRDWAKDRGAVLEIISRQGFWSQAPMGNSAGRRLAFDFPGTCINLSVEVENLAEFEEADGGDYA